MRNLSKFKILSFRQCPKRLWLELHQPELRDDSASEASFAIGHQVGDIARQIYDPEGKGTLISVDELGFKGAFARTAELLASSNEPVFEAAFSIPGGLALADVMLLAGNGGNGRSWRMVEVKSSTSVKDYHHDDIAFQAYLARRNGVDLKAVALAHIDNSFVYPGGGDYRGLLNEVDLTEEAFSRSAEVESWLHDAHAVAVLDQSPEIETGPQCGHPFHCPFAFHCNLGKSDMPEADYPLACLPRFSGARLEKAEELGITDMREVPDELLTDIQAWVKKHTVEDSVYFDAEGAASVLASHPLPAYFLDFETIAYAVPVWAGTRPYQKIPFQYSLHVLADDGTLSHHGFLDLSGNDPSRALAESLVAHCGTSRPVFAYNAGFECGRIKELADRFTDLADALWAINDRMVDLRPIAAEHYYHPEMRGSWSLKAVVPALLPDLSYDDLDGVQNGEDAGAAYAEVIAPETPADRKSELETQMLAYCHLDTLALVRMWQVFSGSAGQDQSVDGICPA